LTASPAAQGHNEPFFHRLAGLVPVRVAYTLWVSSLISAIGVATVFSQRLTSEEQPAYLGMVIMLSAGFVTIPFAFWFCHRQMVNWAGNIPNFVPEAEDDPTHWFLEELAFFRGSALTLILSMVFGAAVIVIYQLGGFFKYSDPLSTNFARGLVFVTAGLAGFGIYAMFAGHRAIWRFGRRYNFQVDGSLYGILSTGAMLVRCNLIVAVTWAFYVASAILGLKAVFGTARLDSEYFFNLPMLTLAAPTFIFFLFLFFWSQVPIHRKMVTFRRLELANILERRRELIELASKNPSPERLNELEIYETRLDRINAFPTWSFSRRSILGAISSSILPILLGIAIQATVKEMGLKI
jgi:hypothetical protein